MQLEISLSLIAYTKKLCIQVENPCYGVVTCDAFRKKGTLGERKLSPNKP